MVSIRRRAGINLIAFKAHFRSDIEATIPQILSHLSHERSNVRIIAVDLFKAFAADGKYC